ncbi:MAG: hypothetical protein WD038_12235 [Balneolales bacterium]
MMKSALSAFYFIIIIVLLSSCKTTEPPPARPGPIEPEPFSIPAGVDSLTAHIADSIAGQSFVSIEREQQAEALKSEAREWVDKSDSLWIYLTMDPETDYPVSEDDSIKAIESYNEGAEALIESQEVAQSGEADEQWVQQQNELLDEAIKAFEDALVYNPFDTETKYGLSLVYQRKAIRLTDDEEYKKAIDILERLTQIEKGEDAIYARLAENYYALGLWSDAARNFQTAGEVFRENKFLGPDIAEPGELTPEDSSTLFHYVYYTGESQTNMYQADDALTSFGKAKSLANNEELREDAQYMIDYIHWDDGNIAGRMARDSINTLRNQGDLEIAQEQYLKLLDRLKTPKAKDEIHWRTALTHYEMGKEKEAADRLMNLVKRTETSVRDGMPVDSTYNQYFEDYGIICYNIGSQYLHQERDRLTALKYFKQISTLPWSNRAKTNLEIANIVSNNIPEAISHAEKALAEVNMLGQVDEKELYRRLSNLHRRQGDTENARKYIELWRET